jgi:exonuclease SbcC
VRLHRIRLRGIGPFTDVDLDLDALPGPLVAVTGENGAGKTSILQLGFAGALYRSTPTQGTLASRARGRDSLVEAHVGDLLIRHHVDATVGNKVLVQRGGQPLVDSAGVRDFDRWAATNLPAQDLFFASVFGAPGAAGFLGMTAAERKKVLLRALGIEKYEALAKRASEENAAAQLKAAAVAAQLHEEGRKISVDVARAWLDAATATLASAEERARAARAAVADAQRAEGARELALVEAKAHASRLAELTDQRVEHLDTLRAAERRLERLLVVTSDAADERAIAATVDTCRDRLESLRRAIAAADEHRSREEALLAEEHDTGAMLVDLERRRAAAAHDLAGRDAVREQAGRAPGLRDALAATEQAGRDAAQAAAQCERDSRAETQAAERARGVALEQRARAAAAARRTEALAGVEAAEVALPALRARAAETAAAEQAADAEVERLRGLRDGGKDTRIRGFIEGLAGIVVRSKDHQDAINRAHATRRVDDALVVEHAAAPAALDAARETALAAEQAAEQAERAFRDAEVLAARRPDLDAARAEQDVAVAVAEQAESAAMGNEANAEDAGACKARYKALAEEHGLVAAQLRVELAAAERAERRLPDLARAEATIAGLAEQLDAARAAHEAAVGRVRALGEPPARPSPEEVAAAEEALSFATAAAARLPELAAAEATVLALDEQIAREAAAIGDVDARIAALGPAPTPPGAVDLGALAEALRAAEQEVHSAVAALATAEQTLTAATAIAERIAELTTALRAEEQLAADWAMVARGLGRDGLQALEIDAAGPELTGLVNDLLRACFGSRYTVTIATTRARKSGEGDREVCDVLVYDAQNPQDGDRDGREFSDGQKVILGEAIRGALSVLSCRRAGLRGVTLVRDEATGVLDRDNAPAYVRMLRRLAEMVDASRVLFVAHDPALWALADSRVHVANGRVDVVGALQEAA